MENQYQSLHNFEVDAVVIENLINMFGDVTSKDVIVAVLESCGGDLNLAVEGIMNLTSENHQQSDGGAHTNSVMGAPIQRTNSDTGVNYQQCALPAPVPIVTAAPNQSYAAASQNTGAIPKKNMGPKPAPDKKGFSWLPDFGQIIKHHNEGTRILIILRGVPGSGKSYLAKKIIEMTVGSTSMHYTTHIFSTDDYFMVGGTFVYDRYKLSEAHAWNQRRAWLATQQGLSPILIDNTNVEFWEMEPYLRDGVRNGYIIEVMEPKTPWARKANQLARKNGHGVPLPTIKRMLDKYQDGITSESLRKQYGLSYPTSMIPPVMRNLPVFDKNRAITDSPQTIQENQSGVAVNIVEEGLPTGSAVITPLPCVQESILANLANEATNVVDNIKPGEHYDLVENKLKENYKQMEAKSAEEINQKIYLEAQEQLEKLHSFELAWENGENWDEKQEQTKCEAGIANAIKMEPKPQRKNVEADLLTENVACASTAYSQSACEAINTDVLMDSVSKCQDWRQISMYMPPWTDVPLTDLLKTPGIPIDTMSSATCMEMGDTDDSGLNLKVISAMPRDINEFYVANEKEKIPDKRMLDKSSMTTDHDITEVVRCKNEEKHFIAFRKLFKNISRAYLRDIFDQCRGDVNWAVEIVLDGMANKELTDNTEEFSDQEDEVLEECSCISNYHVIPNLETSSAVVTTEHVSEPESTSQPRRKIKKDVSVSDLSLQLKRQIEQNVSISENHYSEHCLKIRKMRRGEYTAEDEDGSGQSSSAATAVSTVEATSTQNDDDESDDDESTASVEEIEKVVDVNIGKDLVRQLDILFGRKDMEYPDNTVFNISIPMSILNEMNALWMESLMNQLDDHHKQSELMLKQDEEFARELEMKELELAQAGMEPEVPDFKEIMDMDLAIALYHKDVAEWRNNEPMDLAARLSREKLFNLFPEVSPDVLSELLMAHDNNFQSTVEGLLVSTGRAGILNLKNGVNRFVMEKEIERRDKVLKEEQKALSEVEWPLLPKGEHIEMATVNGYREEAEMHLVRRNQSYNKAQDYVRRGMTLVASHFCDVAAFHKLKYEQANSLAAATLIQFHASKRDSATIDLHFLRVGEAKEALDLFLDTHIQKLKENQGRGGPRYHIVYFITGRGLHSPGLPRIKPAVKKRLVERGLACRERNPGLLTTKVCAEDMLSYQLHVP